MTARIKDVAAKQALKTHVDPRNGVIKKVLIRSKLRENQRWSFSFRFFQEIKNFGLDSSQIDKGWMLSVIYRLQELSNLSVADVTENRAVMEGTLRIHDINWDQRSIPIKREDLSWIDSSYLGNPEEYPIMQISVSKAEGRLIGFFDEDSSFQIILLDPLHNAQPSKFNGYKVRLCKPLGCEVTAIRYATNKIVEKIANRDCSCAQDLQGALKWSKKTPGMAIVIPSGDDQLVKDADEVIQMKLSVDYAGILQAGIDNLIAGPPLENNSLSDTPA